MKPGTLVMLNKAPSKGYSNEPKRGAIGEVVDHSGKPEWFIAKGAVCVSFPQNISHHVTGYWQYSVTSLIPLSDPDAELGSEDETKIVDKNFHSDKKPITEDLV